MRAFTLAAAIGLAQAQVALAQEVTTKQYEDGGVYEGTFLNGRQHGQGSYRLPNGYEYRGEWFEGEIRGDGTATFPNGSVYEGQFARGKPEGVGRITFADGGSYEGEWEDGKITGRGIGHDLTLAGAGLPAAGDIGLEAARFGGNGVQHAQCPSYSMMISSESGRHWQVSTSPSATSLSSSA